MIAVVLVGGEGTRMRPLTETIPKPLIPLVDRPFLDHVLDHLARNGVHEVLLSSPYLESRFASFIEARHGDPSITWITEATPLGTGGAVANAARQLDQAFLVCNGDILTDLDLTALVAFHRRQGAAATITLSPVEDARAFGLVSATEEGLVLEFREKPAEAIPGLVNAGTYVLEPEAIRETPADRAVSIERETFPGLIAAAAPVYGFVSDAYWMDLGTPEKYLQATFDALEGIVDGLEYQAPHVEPTAAVSLRARLGRWVVVGPGASVADEAEVEDAVVLEGAVVERGAKIRDSIIGPRAVVGSGALVTGTVLAEGAEVPENASANGARVGAGLTLQP
jgi:mannose-1-phosphate guanylyltransferase